MVGRGAVHGNLKQFHKARLDFLAALRIDPEDRNAINYLNAVEKQMKIKPSIGGGSDSTAIMNRVNVKSKPLTPQPSSSSLSLSINSSSRSSIEFPFLFSLFRK